VFSDLELSQYPYAYIKVLDSSSDLMAITADANPWLTKITNRIHLSEQTTCIVVLLVYGSIAKVVTMWCAGVHTIKAVGLCN
jgi:hypothetical protein